MKKNIFLSIIMPAYNECKDICQNVILVDEVIKPLVKRYEIILVDDGSRDNTAEKAELVADMNENIHVVRIYPNQGKGNALCVGTAEAKGDRIMFLDSDLDLSPATIGDFLNIMDEKDADVVIGSKLHPDSQISYPAIRRFISFCYYLFIRVLFRLKVRDTQTGMKLFKAEVIKPVMKKILVKRFAFDIEVLSIINKSKFKIVDAPIILEYGRSVSWGRIDLKTIFNVFLDTLAIFYRLYILKYYDQSNEIPKTSERRSI